MFNNTKWMNKCRWYEFKIESSGKSYKILHDPFGECSLVKSGAVKLPEGFKILNIMCDINAKGSSDNTVTHRLFDKGVQGFTLPDKSSFDSMQVYVFAYKGAKL